MEKFVSLNDAIIDLRDEMKLDYNFLKDYTEVHDKFHDIEMITAEFNYNDCIGFRSKLDLKEIKNIIYEDFKKLPYRPDHLYIGYDDVVANWFISNEHILNNEFGTEEIKIILKNLESSFSNLVLCNLYELYPVSGQRDISKNMYFYNYYRKKLFEKVLLKK